MLIDLNNAIKKINCLGFAKLVDCMPRYIPNNVTNLKCDYAIVQAARVSYGEGFKDKTTDENLIRYLLKNNHTSPFEMVKFKFHMKMPLFVQRQWIRHRTANVNEISARYTSLKNELYIPNELRGQSLINKQMSEGTINTKEIHEVYKNVLENNIKCFDNYEKLLELGVSREIARIFLPLNIYTEFYWCIDLNNYLKFIKLRSDTTAQPEIIEYANATLSLIKDICPVSINAYEEFIKNSITIYPHEQKIINNNLSPIKLTNMDFKSIRDRREFENKLKKIRNLMED